MNGTTESVPLDNLGQISQKLADLQQQLQTQAPGYEGLLQRIHTDLIKDPDLAHLLTDEQVGVLVAGLSKKKNIVLVELSSPKKRTTTADGKKSLKDVGIDDL